MNKNKEEFVDLKKAAVNKEASDKVIESNVDKGPFQEFIDGSKAAKLKAEAEKKLTPEEIAIQSNEAVEFQAGDDSDESEATKEFDKSEIHNGLNEPEIVDDDYINLPTANDSTPKLNIITGNEIDNGKGFEGGVIPPTQTNSFKEFPKDNPQTGSVNPYTLYGFNIYLNGVITPVKVSFPTMDLAKAVISGKTYMQLGEVIDKHEIKSGTPGIAMGNQELFRYSNDEWIRS